MVFSRPSFKNMNASSAIHLLGTPRNELPLLSLIAPDKNTAGSTIHCSLSSFSVCAHSRKCCDRPFSQDAMMLLTEENFFIAAICDGFGKKGDLFSINLVDHISDIFHEKRHESFDLKKTKSALIDAIIATSDSLKKKKFDSYAGTTLVLVIIFPDGRFFAFSLGDSPLYLLNGLGTRRFFDYNKIIDPTDAVIYNLQSHSLKPAEYVKIRNYLSDLVSNEGVHGKLESEGGFLPPFSSLLLASDGLSKNLVFALDQYGNVADVGGCQDLFSISRMIDHKKSRLEHALKVLNGRIEQFNGSLVQNDKTAHAIQDDDLSAIEISRVA